MGHQLDMEQKHQQQIFLALASATEAAALEATVPAAAEATAAETKHQS